MHSPLWLLAEATATKSTFEFGRIQSISDWWLYAGILLVILAPLHWIYRRDSAELPWYLRFGLPLLRTAVLLGLLVVYLQPRYRSEREEHLDSRVLMLVDTSLSMGLDTNGVHAGKTRLQQVADGLENSQFLGPAAEETPGHGRALQQRPGQGPPRGLAHAGPCRGNGRRWRGRDSEPGEGREKRQEQQRIVGSLCRAGKPAANNTAAALKWSKQLLPGGTETRLGEALEQLVREERNTPVSGIVVFSDGGLNAGASPDMAEELARESHIPIYTVGLGSEKKPVDVRVAELNVPSRVFPGDRVAVEGSIQGFGLKGRTVRVDS